MQIVFWISLLITFIYNFYRAEQIICKAQNAFIQIFAPPGTGKTTLAARYVRNANINNKKIYSNVKILSSIEFKLSELGKKEFKDCSIIIDEAGIEVGNRDWKNNLSKTQIKFLKKHRHYNVDIYIFSQSYNDVDNKFRELTTKLILLEKSKIPFMVNMKAIDKTIDIVGGQIVEFYNWNKYESSKFFTPNCWAYFNSYEKDEPLPEKEIHRFLKTDTQN